MSTDFQIISKNGVIFVEDKVLELHRTLNVDKAVEVVGKNFTIKDDILITSKCTFNNVNFVGSIIYIKNGGEAEFNNCVFEASNEVTTIAMVRGSGSKISLINCTFFNYSVAVSLNDNYINILENNLFEGCDRGIVASKTKNLLSAERILENLVMDDGNSIFIEIDEVNLCDDRYKSSIRRMSYENNYSRIVLKSGRETIIDTNLFYVENTFKLREALAKVSDGNIIFLKEGSYEGSFRINRAITICGEDGANIVPGKDSSLGEAFLIDSKEVTIKNVSILSEKDFYFRDGVRFSITGGEGCVLEGVKIFSVQRRGISIWGKNTDSTVIKNCTFNGIRNGVAISIKGRTDVCSCAFNECHIGIYKRYDEMCTIKKCSFNNMDYFMNIGRSVLKTARLYNNKFHNIRKFLLYI